MDLRRPGATRSIPQKNGSEFGVEIFGDDVIIQGLEAPMSARRFIAQGFGRTVLAGALLLAALSTTACVKVAPYERGTLAHPTMTTDDMAIGVDAHVRGVSEGASGGLGGGGGGCGCN
jgi:hypothetical protein